MGYIVFVFLFVHSTFILGFGEVSPVVSISITNDQKDLYLDDSALEGWHSHHDIRHLGPCPWLGLKVEF